MDSVMRFSGDRYAGADKPRDSVAVYRFVVYPKLENKLLFHERIEWCKENCGLMDHQWTVTWNSTYTVFTFVDQSMSVLFKLTYG